MIRRELPVSVDIGSETYKIDADFRTIMNVEGIIFGKKVTDDQKKFAAEMMKEIDIEEKDAIQNAKYYDALKLFYKDNVSDDQEESDDSEEEIDDEEMDHCNHEWVQTGYAADPDFQTGYAIEQECKKCHLCKGIEISQEEFEEATKEDQESYADEGCEYEDSEDAEVVE